MMRVQVSYFSKRVTRLPFFVTDRLSFLASDPFSATFLIFLVCTQYKVTNGVLDVRFMGAFTMMVLQLPDKKNLVFWIVEICTIKTQFR